MAKKLELMQMHKHDREIKREESETATMGSNILYNQQRKSPYKTIKGTEGTSEGGDVGEKKIFTKLTARVDNKVKIGIIPFK